MTDETELEILAPVDEVPGAPRSRRGSKWDAVIQAAIDRAGQPEPWVPVKRPDTFSSTTAKWLRGRTEGLVVEVRADKVYFKWDPEEAARLQAKADEG
jgi:hypothetical protein